MKTLKTRRRLRPKEENIKFECLAKKFSEKAVHLQKKAEDLSSHLSMLFTGSRVASKGSL
jgi:hypothetical protein